MMATEALDNRLTNLRIAMAMMPKKRVKVSWVLS